MATIDTAGQRKRCGPEIGIFESGANHIDQVHPLIRDAPYGAYAISAELSRLACRVPTLNGLVKDGARVDIEALQHIDLHNVAAGRNRGLQKLCSEKFRAEGPAVCLQDCQRLPFGVKRFTFTPSMRPCPECGGD